MESKKADSTERRGELGKRLSRAAKLAVACAFFTACAQAQGFSWNTAGDFASVMGRSGLPPIEDAIDTVITAPAQQVSPAFDFSVIKVLVRYGSEIPQTAFSRSSAQSSFLSSRKTDESSASPRYFNHATFLSRVKSGLRGKAAIPPR